jgi:hypothetical protein
VLAKLAKERIEGWAVKPIPMAKIRVFFANLDLWQKHRKDHSQNYSYVVVHILIPYMYDQTLFLDEMLYITKRERWQHKSQSPNL